MVRFSSSDSTQTSVLGQLSYGSFPAVSPVTQSKLLHMLSRGVSAVAEFLEFNLCFSGCGVSEGGGYAIRSVCLIDVKNVIKKIKNVKKRKKTRQK